MLVLSVCVCSADAGDSVGGDSLLYVCSADAGDSVVILSVCVFCRLLVILW